MAGISLEIHIVRPLAAGELLALDSLNSEGTDHKPHYQEKKKPQNDHRGFLNDGLLFCVTVGSNCNRCVTVTEYEGAVFILEANANKQSKNVTKF